VSLILEAAAEEIRTQKEDVSRLAAVASRHPFYKYNGVWSRELQNLVGSPPACLLVLRYAGEEDYEHS
jgi:hypothetical protein